MCHLQPMSRYRTVLKTKRFCFRRGVSLLEIVIAIVILAVAVIGASGYRYYTALDARKAVMQSTAARIGLLLCESWRGLGGAETYDPTAHLGPELPITAGSGPAKPEDFTLLGSYAIVLNGANYYATLSWKDVSAGLRALSVVVAWAQRPQEEPSFEEADKLFKLTTYTSN